MAEDNYPQAPTVSSPVQQSGSGEINLDADKDFMTTEEISRINKYGYYEKIFRGEHFEAFAIRADDKYFSKEYRKLRYIVANFGALISKVVADLLFIEPPKLTVKDGDQEYVDGLVEENHLRVQNYESALSNSYYGDNLYKIRIGKRNPTDEKSTVIIEETTPKIYLPKVNPMNIKAKPIEEALGWKFKKDSKEYGFKEIHTPGKIENKAYLLEGNKIKSEVSLDTIGITASPVVDTKIDETLIVHVPNWRAGNNYFGISDYFDLESLFFAINNRITKIDNVLDKHTDPILMVPPGVLDEDGQVKKEYMGVIEKAEGEADGTAEYVTWDANLEWAVKELEGLIDILLMMSETAPVVAGLDKGGTVESGRALKYKMVRTLAKVQRKQLYYTEGLKDALFIAQKLGKEWGIEIRGKRLQGEPVRPEVEWRDGLPADMMESVDIETKRIDAGLSSQKESIMRLDDVDEKTAEEKVKEIRSESSLNLSESSIAESAGQFTKPKPNGQVEVQ